MTSRGCARRSSIRRSARCGSASTPSSCTTRTAIWRIRSCRRCPTSAPTSTAARWRTACGSASRSRRRCARRCRRGIALGARITGSDWRDGGLTADDAVDLLPRRSRPTASTTSTCRPAASPPTRAIRPTPGYNVPIAERVKREAGIATRVVGLIVDAGAGRGDRRRRQGRHGGARPRACSTIRAGAGTRPRRSAPRCRARSNICAPGRSCGRRPPSAPGHDLSIHAQSRDRRRAAVGRDHGDRRHRRHAEGRHLPADADRSRPAGARLVQGARRAARLPRHRRRHGRDVRAARGQRPTCRRSRSAAISTPSRPAASSTACSACSARSKRCAPWSRPATRPTRRSRW